MCLHAHSVTVTSGAADSHTVLLILSLISKQTVKAMLPLFLHSAMDKSHTVKLFVGNLALDTTQEELSAIFEPYGQVVSCSVLRQFAFVHLQGEGAAERAIRELNGREFRGRNLVVEESRGRPLHSTKVFVGNLSGMCTTEDLQQLFQTFGKVLECDKVKGKPGLYSQLK